MKSIRTTAPGKIVILGEFAVLDSASAISMAIDKRAIVTIKESAGDSHLVRTIGYKDGNWPFNIDKKRKLSWLDSTTPKNIRNLLEIFCLKFKVQSNLKYEFTLDSSLFFDGKKNKKIGFGSSSALIVAMTAAFLKLFNSTKGIDYLAHEIHSDIQGRLGSGIDVETSLQGGMLVYNRHQVANSKNIKLRSDLRFKIFWSGEEIKTIDQIKLFSDYNAKSFRQLCDISNKLSNNWCKYDPKKLISEMKTYVKCLEEFSMDFGLDLFGANHNYLSEYTKNMTEAVYKPCGAGGDIGICIASSESDLNSVVRYAKSIGMEPFELHCDQSGYLIELEN